MVVLEEGSCFPKLMFVPNEIVCDNSSGVNGVLD